MKHSYQSSSPPSKILSTEQTARFREACSDLTVALSGSMIEKFQAYVALLLEWNKRIHLVSKRDAESNRILRHFVDSLSVFKAVDLPREANLLDLGSGAGFPAVPVKIVREDIRTTLVESSHKKTLFLERLTRVLGLKRMDIVNQRAEELAYRDGFKGTFDLVTAKAFGRLKDGVRLSMPFLTIGGLFLAYKGRGIHKEIREMDSVASCRISSVTKIEVPSVQLVRWLVILEKVKPDFK